MHLRNFTKKKKYIHFFKLYYTEKCAQQKSLSTETRNCLFNLYQFLLRFSSALVAKIDNNNDSLLDMDRVLTFACPKFHDPYSIPMETGME